MASFEIPDGPMTVALVSQSVKGKPVRAAQATYTVTNRSDQTVTCRLKPAPQGDTLADWLGVQGERERPFGPSETQKVTVPVTVPHDAAPGDYKFRLQAMNVNDPGNDFAESMVTTFTVPVPPPPGPRDVRWPYALIAGGVVLLIVVGAVMVLSRVGGAATSSVVQTVPAPDVSSSHNLTFATAKAILKQHGFPDVIMVSGTANGAPPTTVISQDPAPNAPVDQTKLASTLVKLTVDPGVQVPDDLVGQMTLGAAGVPLAKELQGFNVTVEPNFDGVASASDPRINTVRSSNPSSGVWPKGAPLTLYVYDYCPSFQCLAWQLTLAQRTKIPAAKQPPSA